MKYCKRCTYPENHPLNLILDQEGICSGCRVHEEKDTLDWAVRFERLQAIADEYRDESGQNYDCIIHVSGGRDSYFIVHVAKNLLKLNPLLVGYNKHYNTTIGIQNQAYLRIAFDCDFVDKMVGVDTIRAVNRATLQERGSMYWHEIAGYTVPLVIWGAHQGCDQVGMFSHTDEVEMTRKYRREHDLMNLEAEDLARIHPELNGVDLEPFVYPSDQELESVGVRGIYLSNYIRWDSKAQHELMIEHCNYDTALQQRTFDTYNHVDCHHYTGLHDWIKLLKWGYSRIHDHTSREIRLKRMARSTALKLIDEHHMTVPEDINLFLDWMGMSSGELLELHRSSDIWERDGEAWRLKDCVTNYRYDDWEMTEDDCDFIVRGDDQARFMPDHDRYMLIGSGYTDARGPRKTVKWNGSQ